MKRNKQFLAALTAVCMVLGLWPATALAAGAQPVVRTTMLDLTGSVTYSSTSNGQKTVNASTTDITDSAEGWSWDHNSKTLVLSGATIEVASTPGSIVFGSSNTAGIHLDGISTIQVAAGTENRVSAAENQGAGTGSYGIHANGDLTIKGSGTLYAVGGASEKSGGIYIAQNGLTIASDVTVNALGGTASGKSYGILVEEGIADGRTALITENAHITATGGEGKDSYGIYGCGFITSGHAEVKAVGGAADNSYGIAGTKWGSSDVRHLEFTENSRVEAVGGSATILSKGIYAKSDTNVLISDDAEVNARGGDVGTQSGGSSLNGSCGIDAEESVIISGGAVTARGGATESADSCGIRAHSGGVLVGNFAQIDARGGEAKQDSVGIHGGKFFTASGSGVVTAAGVSAEAGSYGVFASAVTIDSATIYAAGGEATAGEHGRSCGIRAQNEDFLILGGARVTAIGGEAKEQSDGLVSYTKKLEISDTANVTASGGKAQTSNGIFMGSNNVANDMIISDQAQVIAQGGQASVKSNGISSEKTMTVSGSAVVTAAGGQAGGGASNGVKANTVNVEGGSLVAVGETETSGSGYGISTDRSGAFTISGGITEMQGKTGAVKLAPDLTGYTSGSSILLGRKTSDGELEPAVAPITGYVYLQIHPAIISVKLSPLSVSVTQGRTQQFTAETAFQDGSSTNRSSFVNWSVSGAKDSQTAISDTGRLTVASGETAASLTVVCQSKADAAISAAAIVTVSRGNSPSPSGGGGGGSSKTSYAITVRPGSNGSISPDGVVQAEMNSNQLFKIVPAKGYEVYNVLVDGVSVGAVESYTFKDVRAAHTIEAQFVAAFDDVAKDAWYHEAVQYAAWNGIFSGTGVGRFSPEENMSRAMAATILYHAAGEPAAAGEGAYTPFTDVAADSWYGAAVRWAHSQGIISGVSRDAFQPEAPVTREQFAVMLYHYAQSPAPKGSLSVFADGSKASPWAADALCWAVDNGFLSGKGNGILDPQGYTTRAEVAAVLMKYMKTTDQ